MISFIPLTELQIKLLFFGKQNRPLYFCAKLYVMTGIDILLVVLAALCLLLGLVGCIIPIIPACPLSYLGMFLLHCTSTIQFTPRQLLLWAMLVIVVQVMDYIFPILGAKKMGGSKAGSWGCTIGMVVGMFVGPWGIILGPFFGAIIGELIDGKKSDKAFIAGLGSFLGFLAGTLSKLIISVALIVVSIKAFF